MKKFVSKLLAICICAAAVLSFSATASAGNVYCVNCHTPIDCRWVNTGWQHFATCMCGYVTDGNTIHTPGQPSRSCRFCYPNGAPVMIKRESPEVANSGKDLTFSVPGEIYADQIHLYSAKDKGNDYYEYNKYITVDPDNIVVGNGTVTLKAALLDNLDTGYYAVTIVTTAGSQFCVFKR